jgi:hypothetical protein
MQKQFILFFILFSVFLPNCEKENVKPGDSDCEGIFCTDIFVSVNILIKHSNDNSPVILTKYKVIRTSDNEDITIKDNDLTDNNGYYVIVNDSSTGLITNKNTEVEFQGYINDSLVVQKLFIVKKDCCHVSLVSGDPVVYI